MDEKKPKEAPPKAPREHERPKDEPPKPQEARPPKSNAMAFAGIIAGIVVLELVVGIVIVKVAMPRMPDEIEAKSRADSLHQIEAEATSMGSTTAEKPIEVLVNIANTNGDRFLKAAVVLEYEEKGPKRPAKKEGKEGGEGGSPLGEAILERMPKYKSWLIENLSKLSLAEITAPEAKERIRKDFLRMVNNSLPPDLGAVKDVYFTQFIIQ